MSYSASLRRSDGSDVEDDHVRVWHVSRSGRPIGPLSKLELALAAKHGLLAGNDLIWKDGLPRWYAASEVPGLLSEVTAPPAQPDANAMADAVGYGATRPSQSPIFGGRGDAPASGYQPTPTRQLPAPAGYQAGLPQREATAVAGQGETDLPTGPALSEAPVLDTTYTRYVADTIAGRIIGLLERHQINDLSDITSDARLRQLAAMVYDAMPFALRLVLRNTVGQAFIEDKVFEVFTMLRSTVSTETRSRDLRQLVLDQSPAIARKIDRAVRSTTNKAGSVANTSWNTLLGPVRAAKSGAPLVTRGGGR